MDTYTLLIIDDDPNIRNLLNELLSGRPELRLIIAGDGKEAVRQFAENRIDVVLTDIHMPGFTGLELMADMKKINFKPEILVMTANGTPENVETARQIGARSVILKPFDDLEVIEVEINKALAAAQVARSQRNGNGNGHDAPPEAAAAPSVGARAPVAPIQPTERPAASAKPAARPVPPAPAHEAPKAPLWPSPATASRAPTSIPVSAAPSFQVTTPGGQELPEVDAWQSDLVGNDTPPPPARPAAPPKPVAPAATVASPRAAAPAAWPAAVAPPAPAPPRPTPIPAAAPPAPAPPHPVPIPSVAAPAPAPPRPAPAPSAAAPIPPVPAPHPAAHHAPPSPSEPVHAEAVRQAGSHPEAAREEPEGEIPQMPSDLEAIFRTATSFDTGKMRMQVPIVCLQTWEEKGAIEALRRLAATLHREFFVWSVARGLVRENGQAMGEMYRDAARALEFIRRQKSNGLYVLADFRPGLDDRAVVRMLREMVMEMETARLMLVLTGPRLPAPPELMQACVVFDWPAGGTTDLNRVYQEIVAEVAATSGHVVRLDPPARDALLKRVREMPAGRARFEIAHALMSVKPQN